MVMATNSCNSTFDHWWDPEGRKNQIIRRRNWRASMKIYLDRTPLVAGVSSDFASTIPDAKALADVYVKLMEHKLDIDFLKNFASNLPKYTIEDWIAAETFETAEMLARCFVKSFAELSHVCSKSDEVPIVIRHHAAQAALWLTEMQSLVLQGGEQTDLRLPDNHVHKISALRQREVRQQFGDAMFNVALRPV